MPKKKTNKPKNPAMSQCRDCKRQDSLPRYEYFKAGPPRCVACGGMMEYLGSWHGARSDRGNTHG